MTWQWGSYTEQWLVADDGEIIERVINSGMTNAYYVESIKKLYATESQAKAAAEKHAKGLT